MFCRRCGAELKENAKFCTKCGSKVESVLEGQSHGIKDKESFVPVGENLEYSKAKTKKKGIEIGVVIAVIVGCIVISLAVCAVFYLSFRQDRTEDTKIQQVEEAEVVEEDTIEQQEKETEAVEDKDDTSKKDVGLSAEETDVEEESKVQKTILGDDSINPTAIHEYQLVTDDVTWSEAYTKSQQVKGGYLAHINSKEEMDAIVAQIEKEGLQNIVFWIGGMRDKNSDDYYWIDTELNSVGQRLNENSMWLENEPSLYDETLDVEERYMDFFYLKRANGYVWNDTVGDLLSLDLGYQGRIGYIIEIER